MITPTPRQVVERRREEREALVGRARTLADDLRRDLRIHAVVVFGSVARGDFNDDSDVDVLVVADDLHPDPVERMHALPAIPARVEPVLWTVDEWRERCRRHDPIAVESSTVGVWLQGDRDALTQR